MRGHAMHSQTIENTADQNTNTQRAFSMFGTCMRTKKEDCALTSFSAKLAVSVQSVASLRGLAVRAMRYAPSLADTATSMPAGSVCPHRVRVQVPVPGTKSEPSEEVRARPCPRG